jgi:hypothetical protein
MRGFFMLQHPFSLNKSKAGKSKADKDVKKFVQEVIIIIIIIITMTMTMTMIKGGSGLGTGLPRP